MRPKALRRPDNRRPFTPPRWFPGRGLAVSLSLPKPARPVMHMQHVGLPGPKRRRPSEIPFRYRKMSVKTGPTAPLRSGPFIREQAMSEARDVDAQILRILAADEQIHARSRSVNGEVAITDRRLVVAEN